MKKIFTIVILLISSICLFSNNNVMAKLIIDEGDNFENSIPLKSEDYSFNAIKGIELEETFYNSDFYKAFKDYLYEVVEFGIFEYNCKIYNENENLMLTIYFIVEKGDITEGNIHLNDELIYEFEYIDEVFSTSTVKIIDLNNESNTCDKFKFKNVLSYREGIVMYYSDEKEIVYDDLFADMSGSLLYGYIYEYNQFYSNKDIYFVTTNSSPITIKEIENSIRIIDETDSNPTFKIIEDEYKLGQIDITNGGQYSIFINAYDNSGNITIQKCNVYVHDDIYPVLIGENLEKKWNETFNENDLLKQFSCDDSTAKIRIIDKPDELLYDSKNRPGIYKVTASATDSTGNESSYQIEVIIKDNEKPNITPKKDITELKSNKKYTKQEILDLLNISDSCYGTELKTDVLNYDYYLEYWNIPSNIELKIIATDPSGNSKEYTLEAYIKDRDFPQIDFNQTYTLVLPSGSTLTKEEIIEKLINSGQITNIINVESEYFNSDNPIGSYDLFVTDDKENVYTYKIEVETPNFSYDIPEEKEEKENNKYIIYVVIGITSILAIGIIMLIIYKKRKH